MWEEETTAAMRGRDLVYRRNRGCYLGCPAGAEAVLVSIRGAGSRPAKTPGPGRPGSAGTWASVSARRTPDFQEPGRNYF